MEAFRKAEAEFLADPGDLKKASSAVAEWTGLLQLLVEDDASSVPEVDPLVAAAMRSLCSLSAAEYGYPFPAALPFSTSASAAEWPEEVLVTGLMMGIMGAMREEEDNAKFVRKLTAVLGASGLDACIFLLLFPPTALRSSEPPIGPLFLGKFFETAADLLALKGAKKVFESLGRLPVPESYTFPYPCTTEAGERGRKLAPAPLPQLFWNVLDILAIEYPSPEVCKQALSIRHFNKEDTLSFLATCEGKWFDRLLDHLAFFSEKRLLTAEDWRSTYETVMDIVMRLFCPTGAVPTGGPNLPLCPPSTVLRILQLVLEAAAFLLPGGHSKAPICLFSNLFCADYEPLRRALARHSFVFPAAAARAAGKLSEEEEKRRLRRYEMPPEATPLEALLFVATYSAGESSNALFLGAYLLFAKWAEGQRARASRCNPKVVTAWCSVLGWEEGKTNARLAPLLRAAEAGRGLHLDVAAAGRAAASVCDRLAEKAKKLRTTLDEDACSNPACPLPAEEQASGGVRFLRCSGCERTRYCGKACQREHWRDHKSLCKLWRAAVRTSGPSEPSVASLPSSSTVTPAAEGKAAVEASGQKEQEATAEAGRCGDAPLADATPSEGDDKQKREE